LAAANQKLPIRLGLVQEQVFPGTTWTSRVTTRASIRQMMAVTRLLQALEIRMVTLAMAANPAMAENLLVTATVKASPFANRR